MAYVLWNHINPGGSLLKNICVEGKEVKYVKDGNDILFYDIQKEIIYDTPSVFLLYPYTEVSPSGGTISPSIIDYSQFWRRVGYSEINYEQDQIINEGATITFKIIEGEGASVDNNGVVTWKSRGTDYGFNSRYAVVEMTVTLNGLSEKVTSVVSQGANTITNMLLSIPDPGTIKATLSEYEAWECPVIIESTSPASSKCLLTFSSGAILEDYNQYVDFKIDYYWESDQYYIALSEYDKESCEATLLSRYIEYDPNYRSAIVTRRAYITATLKALYLGNLWISQEEVFTTTNIRLKPNLLFIKDFIINPGSISGPNETYPAKGDTKTINNVVEPNIIGTLEFSSKEQITNIDDYGEIYGPEYSWMSYEGYAIVENVNSPSTTVEIKSRGTIIGPERLATITRFVCYQYRLFDLYGADSIVDAVWCETSITLESNYINKVEALVEDYSLGDHFYYPSIDEYGGTVSPQFNGSALYWFSSEAGPFIYSSNSPGSWNFSRTYYIVSSNSYASLNTSNGYITWSPNTVNDKQYVTIGSTYTVECISNEMSASHSLLGTAVAMMEEIKIVITYYDPVLTIKSIDYIPASGGEIKYSDIEISYSLTKETINYAISSTPTYEYITTGGILDYVLYDSNKNVVSKVSGEHLGKEVTPTTIKGYISASVTMNGKTGTLNDTIYLEANLLNLYTFIDTFSYNKISYRGGTVVPDLTHSCLISFTSGSKENWSYGGKTYSYGTLRCSSIYYNSPGYTYGSSFDYSNGAVTWESNDSESSRKLSTSVTVEYVFDHISGILPVDSSTSYADSILLGKPEKELLDERIEVVFNIDDSIFDANGTETNNCSYTVWYYATWIKLDGTKYSEQIDVTNSLWRHYYRMTAGSDYFSVTWNTGIVTTKSSNNSGNDRTGTILLEIEYYSPNSDKYLSSYPTLSITLKSSDYYLTISSNKARTIALSTRGDIKGNSSTGTISLTGKSPYEESITNGISSIMEGKVTSSGTRIYIYEVENNILTNVLLSFVYETGKSINISI